MLDTAHSMLWNLISSPDPEWTIQDATTASGYIIPRAPRFIHAREQDTEVVQRLIDQLDLDSEIVPEPFELTQTPFWQNIEAKLAPMEAHVEQFRAFPPRTLAASEWNSLLHFVIALLFTEIPPRRNKDWQTMRIVENGDQVYCNAFDLQYVTFRRFKSFRRDGEVTVPLSDFSPRLLRALSCYLKHHPLLPLDRHSVPFLCTSNGRPFTKINSMTRLLQRAIGTTSQQLRVEWWFRYWGQ